MGIEKTTPCGGRKLCARFFVGLCRCKEKPWKQEEFVVKFSGNLSGSVWASTEAMMAGGNYGQFFS